MLVVDLRNTRINVYNYSVVGNKNSDIIYFYYPKKYQDYDVYVKVLGENIADKFRIYTPNIEVKDDCIRAKWIMSQSVTVNKEIQVQLEYNITLLGGGEIAQSKIVTLKLQNTLDIEGSVEPVYPSILQELREDLDAEILNREQGDTALHNEIVAEKDRAEDVEAGLQTAINGKVDKVEGKGLSTNDYTDADKNKLAGVEAGAQVNVLEGVKVNNQPLTPTNKVVNIDLTPYALINDMQTYGKSLAVSIDPQTYVLTMSLKDANGNTLNTQEVDLPLETMVVSGSYDDTTKSLILVLKNGQTITIPVADLVAGLVSEQQLAQVLQGYYTKTETDNLLSTVARTDRANTFEYTQNIIGNNDTCLDLRSMSSDKCNIMYRNSNQVQLGNIGFNSSYKPEAYTPTDGSWHLIMLDSDITPIQDLLAELKTIVYDNQYPAVAEIDLTYVTYYALPSQISGDKIIMSAGMDMTKVKGRSYVVNQLAIPFNSTDYRIYAGEPVFDNTNHTVTFNGDGLVDEYTPFNFIKDHKYLVIFTADNSVSGDVKCYVYTLPSKLIIVGSGKQTYFTIADESNGNNDTINFVVTNYVSGTVTFSNFKLVDLTDWFGSNDNIPADLLADPSLFTKKYWKKSLPFDTGHIEDSKPVKVIATGFNKWDEEVIVNKKMDANGVISNGEDCFISKNPIKVIPNTTYYFKSNALAYAVFFDKDNNFVGSINSQQNSSFVTPSNCDHILFNTWEYTSSVYNHDICINISDPLLNGKYLPYQKKEYPIIPIDMGTYTFTGNETLTDVGSDRFAFAGLSSSIKIPSADSVVANIALEGFKTVSKSDVASNDYSIGVETTGNIYIKLENGTTQAQALAYLTGRTLTYELATQSHNPLRSAGSVQDDNEKMNVGTIDLGSLNWVVESATRQYAVIPSDMKTVLEGSIIPNWLFEKKYHPVGFNTNLDDDTTGMCYYEGTLRCYNDGATPTGKLNYELVTPTDQSPAITLPENIEIQKGGTIEIEYDDGYSTPCDANFEVAVSKVLEE